MLRTSVILNLLIFGFGAWAQESPLTITDMKVDPGTVSPGEIVLISCRVKHPEGPTSIHRVAATVLREDRNTTYPMLYDDGTHGDAVADDGIYSLEVTAGFDPGVEKIVFVEVDSQSNEIESEPVVLEVR